MYSKVTGKCLDKSGNDAAQGDALATGGGQELDPDGQKIYDGLAKVINVLSSLVALIVIISIVFGGIQYTTAGGDPQKVAAAKSRIVNSVMAFFVFVFIFAFLQYLVPGGLF